MHKRVTTLIVCIFALASLTGCDKIFSDSPKEVVTKYLNAIHENHFQESWEYVSDADHAQVDKEDYLNFNAKQSQDPVNVFIRKHSTWSVGEQTITGDTAKVDVKWSRPNSEWVAKISVDVITDPDPRDKDFPSEERAARKLKRLASTGDIPMDHRSESVKLIKDNGKWRLSLGWVDGQKVNALIKQGDEAFARGDFDQAKQAYNQANEIDPTNYGADEGLKKIREAAYVDKIKFLTFKAAYFQSGDRTVPGVVYSFKNTGDKTLSHVVVTVYFKDKDGNTISEHEYYPVVALGAGISGDKPLKPGYIWSTERGKFYRADDVPPQWKEGAAEIKVTTLEFVDDD